jgi:TonB-dependent SusC/RagA subfamily outer membrane receptor
MRNLLLTLFLLFFSLQLPGQDLVKGLRRSPYTYVYALTNEEAAQAYADRLAVYQPEYTDVLVDSFPNGQFYTRQLPYGNYLFVYANEEQLVLELESVRNVSAKLLPDGEKLVATVYDTAGALVEMARVTADGKPMKYRPGTKNYQRKFRSNYSMLVVEHAGVKNFFFLQSDQNDVSLPGRVLRKVIYFRPVYTLWKPFQDVVKSIMGGYTEGWLQFFDPYSGWWDKEFNGYLALNKPLYRQGDTVRYKAFVLKKHRPFKKPLALEITGNTRNGRKTFQLTTLQPYRKGAYEGFFLLHDSLGFLLDTYATLTLSKKHYELQQQFKVEDYELKGNNFSLRTSRNKHVQGAPPTLLMRGTDVNGLSLMGAEVQFTAIAGKVNELLGKPLVLVPDTLWRHKLQLEAVGDTRLVLPDSMFRHTGMAYTLYATLKTARQEYLKQQLSMEYAPVAMFDFDLQGDTLHIRYLENGKPVSREAALYIYTSDEDEEQERTVNLPHKLLVNPLWKELDVWTGDEHESFSFDSKPALVSHAVSRTADSLLVSISSGRKIPYWYTLYSGKSKKKKISSGFSSGAPVLIARSAPKHQTYFLQLNWVWAGTVNSAKEDIPLLKKVLNVEMEAPEQVRPGEELALGLKVTNMQGKPVEGVDLTTFAYNKKMPGSMQPQVPYLGGERWRPLYIKELRQQPGRSISGKTQLDWQAWRQRLGLDSIAFYQFLYPQQELYSYTIPVPDSSTQFAPFVIDKGLPQQVHVVYLNDIPVYYSEVETQRAYSFMVNPFRTYKLSLRTATHLITLDSICFDKGLKTVLSLGKEVQQRGIRVQEMLPSLSQQELDHLNRYLIIINHTYNQHYAFLEQHDQLQLLSSPHHYTNTRQLLAGPFIPGSTTYEVVNKFKTSFPLEAGYNYRIQPDLVFAKHVQPEWESVLAPNRTHLQAGEMAITKPKVQQMWQEYLAQKNKGWIKYDYPATTKAGEGRIALMHGSRPDLQQQEEVILEEAVVFSLDDTAFVRVYPVKANLQRVDQLLHGLPPGQYKLIGLLSNNEYLRADTLPVQANATTHLNLKQFTPIPNDVYIEQIHKIIEKNVLHQAGISQQANQELHYINQVGRLQRSSTGTQLVQGTVRDKDNGEVLPGVTVRIKDTNIGAVTDMDGNYQLYINPGDRLVFSFIGYEDVQVSVGGKNLVNVELTADVERLEEVVVMGYGTTKRQSLTGAVVSVLQGRAAGVSITIRGTSSVSSQANPLVVIDGVIYTGDLSKLDAALVTSAMVLKGEEATSLYGSQAANGVIIITTGKPQQANQQAAVLQGSAGQENTLRTNFRDWAFWQPRLSTNEQGRAIFTVKFPDNITAWDTKVLAMGKKHYSGQLNSTIRAVKPLWASLAYPRFLLTGDSAMVYGQVNNYTPDTLEVNTRFTFGTEQQASRHASLGATLLDSAWIAPISTDSLSITYEVLNREVLLDGERRKLPVYRSGVREAKGEFLLLRPDSVTTLSLAAGENPWQLQAFGNMKEPLLNEISYLLDYAYYCNEQAASKLYALLVYNRLRQEQDKLPQQQRLVKKLIRQLVEAQGHDGMWGWWQGNRGEYWITRHVAGALQLAREEGYEADFNKDKLLESLNWRLKGSLYPYEQLGLLEVLTQLKAPHVSYEQYIPVLEDSLQKDELARLRLLRLKAANDLPYTAAEVLALKHETMLGAYYWGSEKQWNPAQTSLVATAWAMDLLREKGATEAMDKAELYLWSNRPGGYWRNTYESSQALLNLIPHTVLQQQLVPSLTLEASGETTQIGEMPFARPLALTADQVALKNTGNTSLYINAYTESWIKNPEAVAGDFTISTRFSNDRTYLKVGEQVALVVEVEVKKAAEYVMIEVPIPAGCSYEAKGKNWTEVHREYYRDRVVIFCRNLPEGKHSFNIALIPRFKGTYTLNPAQVSLMYFPTFFGRNAVEEVQIK